MNITQFTLKVSDADLADMLALAAPPGGFIAPTIEDSGERLPVQDLKANFTAVDGGTLSLNGRYPVAFGASVPFTSKWNLAAAGATLSAQSGNGGKKKSARRGENLEANLV